MSTNQNCIELDKIIAASQSINKQERDQATQQIQAFKLDGATVQVLFEYITAEAFIIQNRLSAALILKNLLKKIYGQHSYSNYDAAIARRKEQERLANDEDDPSNFIDDQGLQMLQTNLVSLLMGCPDDKISKLLLESISLMSKRFVQKEWPSLIPDLSKNLSQQEVPESMRRALEAIKNICKKYRYMFRSDDLYREMNYIIQNLSPLLLNSLCFACQALQQCQSMGPEALVQVKTMISMVNSVLHIFESILSQEELPDFYEENLDQISQVCTFILDNDFTQLQVSPKEQECLYKARAKVVRVVSLYQFKFSEYFESKQDEFFQKIWEQIANQKVIASRECERMIFAIVKYMGDCASLSKYKDFIGQNLQTLFQVLVLPNISITEQDLEEYECEPAQYIKNDLEESDAETRRRICMKFVTKLSTAFEQQVSGLIGGFITSMQAEYVSDKQAHWQKMVTIINLIITASISCYTYQHGATEVRLAPELFESYLQQLIVPELQVQEGASLDNLPVLKATCIKFVYMFRNQVPDNYVLEFVKLFTDYLKSEQQVNQSYAAACIEKLMVKKSSTTHRAVLNESNVGQEVLSKLLQNLCELLNDNQDLYAMRSLLRVVQLSKQSIAPFAGTLGQVLSHFISEVVRDTQVSPNYTYILFETAALSLTFTKQAPEAFEQIESQLTPILNGIIQAGQSEYVGYAFQLYATFIASSQQMKPDYINLCNSVLSQETIDTNWGKEMKYLIPALGAFLTTYICKYPEQAAQQLPNIQTIITHLLKPDIRMEQVALKLCSTVFERLGQTPLQDNGVFLNSVLIAVFTSLHFYRNNTRSKVIPGTIMRAIHIFFASFMVVHGSAALVNACNQVQQGILFMVLNSESGALRHVASPARDRKYVLVAYSRMMAEFADQMGAEVVQQLTSGLIELAAQSTGTGFVAAGGIVKSADDMLVDGAIDKTFAFNRQEFIQLTAAKIEQVDQLATEVPLTNNFVLNCFQETTKKIGQSVSTLLLKPQHGTSLQALIEDTGVTLS